MASPLTIFIALVLLCTVVHAADFTPGELLVVVDDPNALVLASDLSLDAAQPDLAAAMARHGLNRYEFIVGKTTLSERDRRYLILKSERADFDVLTAREELAATGLFRAVSPNWHLDFLVMPNDYYLGSQWHITNPTSGIKLPQAWDEEQGSDDAVIAVMDTGVDWSHPDMTANMWHNPGEIQNNGQDDDGNGYIDDYYGWDCGGNDSDPRPEPYFELGIDVGFHGTHCAGIASCTTNNSIGCAGAGWHCDIMALKLTGGGDPFSQANVTEAYLYAIAEGADVISMSFGGHYSDFGFMQALVNDANAAGIVCVAAAGNDNSNVMLYPAALNHVIAVGATNQGNQRASFSSYGPWVDVAAPGERIWSLIQSNYEFDLLSGLLFMLQNGWDGVNPYMYSDGTSMACPLVAGVAGLVKNIAPQMNSDEMEQHLVDTGDYVPYDQPIGPKVNAYEAVTQVVTSADAGAPAAFGITGCWPNPFNPTTTLSYHLTESGPVRLAIYDTSGRLARVLHEGWQAAGEHRLTWNGRDDDGAAASSGLYFARLSGENHRSEHKLALLK